MTDWLKTLFFALVVLAVMAVITICGKRTNATTMDIETIISVSQAIQKLQPAVKPPRALRLAITFVEAAEATQNDPLLLVAMTMRESSFDPFVERLERRGALGEGGLMQIHGVALRLRPKHCDERLSSAACQIHTGARWLQWVRDHCGGSTARWVGAYGMSACPTEAAARRHRSVKVVRIYYEHIGGEQWQ